MTLKVSALVFLEKHVCTASCSLKPQCSEVPTTEEKTNESQILRPSPLLPLPVSFSRTATHFHDHKEILSAVTSFRFLSFSLSFLVFVDLPRHSCCVASVQSRHRASFDYICLQFSRSLVFFFSPFLFLFDCFKLSLCFSRRLLVGFSTGKLKRLTL